MKADRCSPFTHARTRFPFLVVEAKSEKGGPGFDQIERQSALAIRSCLRLQVKLEADSGHRGSHPLVWFIGYQGDDWRLYYALPDGEQTVSWKRAFRYMPLIFVESCRLLARERARPE
jgi:hypothetical protein